MVSKGSPDWLPSGWTAQYKVQKTGRKIRFYTNLESGKSFYSKDEVIGCIKRIQSQKSQPTSRRIKTQSGDSPVQLTVKTNEYPEWLPDGWKVESRTRMSGSNVGGVYKCYIDPVTDNRFYSKPEVFRYLRTVKNNLCTLKERKTSNDTSSRSQVVIEHYKDEDLPPGWIKEIRIKEKADGIRKDPFYIDPKSRYIFRSKKDVLRYLETGEISRHAFKPKECGDSDQELINGKISRPSSAKGRKSEHSAATPQPQPLAGKEMPTDSSSELPGDQILQLGKRQRRNVSSKLKDASVPHVETVQEIALSQEVVRESEIEEKSHSRPRGVEKPAFMGQRDQILQLGKRQRRNVSSKLKDASVPPVETVQEIALSQEVVRESEIEEKSHSRPRGVEKPAFMGQRDQFLQLGKRQHRNMSSKLKDASVSPVETVQEIALSQEVIRESKIKEKSDGSSASPKVDHPEGKETERISSDELDQEKVLLEAEKLGSNKIDIAAPENTPVPTTASKLEGEQEKIVISDMTEKGDANGEKSKTQNFKKKKNINLPRRSSSRLAGLEPALVPKAETKEVPQASNRNSFTEVSPDAGSTVNADADQACQQLNVRPEREKEDRVSNLKNIPLQENPSNKRETPLECSLDVPEEEIQRNPSNKRKTPLECGLDVPEEKIQRVETEIKDDGKMEAHLTVPIADFWSDPCLEFAIKTLTGALPVESATTTNGPVSNPTADSLQGQSLVKRGSGSRVNKRTQGNQKFKNKKELTSNCQSPSFNNEPKPELASNMISFEQANHHSNEAVLSFHLSDGGIFGEPQGNNEQCKSSCQILPPREVYHPPPEVNSERSNRTDACHGSNIMALDDQHQKFQMNSHTISEAPLSFPFGDSWADPCLDFAFKTLTGAIPIDDSLEIQSFFEERLESSRSQKESSAALPDFGSPNLFQNDISSHFDGPPEKPVSAQHLSLDPLLTVGNGSLPSCSGFNSQQQPCVDRNRSFKGR